MGITMLPLPHIFLSRWGFLPGRIRENTGTVCVIRTDPKDYVLHEGGDKYFLYLVARMYNPQIQISAESGTKRSIFRQKNKTKRSKKRLHTTLIKPEQKVNEDLCSGFIVS